MKQARRILVMLLMLAVSGVAGLIIALKAPYGDGGPSYAGRSLAGWIAQYRESANIGPNSPPGAPHSVLELEKGKLGSAREGLYDAAEIAVTGPTLGIIVPGVIIGETIRCAPDQGAVLFGAALAGAAGGVAVAGAAVMIPAVAGKGLIRSLKTVSPQELAEREADLQIALKEVAAQERFQQFMLAAAEQKSPGRLLAMDLNGQPGPPSAAVDAILEARIEQLRLERARSDEGSYFLRINVRVRLVRRAGDGLLYEQSVEYRSGRALFLDWTPHGALQGVAETGYRALAEYLMG